MLLDPVRGVGHLDVAVLDEVPDAGQFPLDLLQLGVDGLQPLALLGGHAVHLLVHHLDQLGDAALGEDVVADALHHQLLEAAGVEPGGIAGPAALLDQGLADVVGELAALGVLAAERPLALVALNQPAEQVGAAHPAGVSPLGCTGVHQLADAAELGLRDAGGERLLDAHRLGLVLSPGAPDQGARVDLVSEDEVDAILGPELSRGTGDALVVEGAGDFQHSGAGLGQVEDAPDHGGGVRVQFQGGPLLGPVWDHDPVVAVRGPAAHPVAPGRGLPHTPGNLLGKIFRVKFVHALDDSLKQLAGGGVVGVLGDGDHADSLAPEHGLEGDGVLALPGEPRKLPDQNLLERSIGFAGLVDHLAELGPIGDPAALGLVDELADHQVAVLVRVVPKRP